MMRRREFLSHTAVTTAGGLAVGCASAIPRAGTTPLSEAAGREVAERLEGTLAGLNHLRLISGGLERGEVAGNRNLGRFLEHADPMAKRAVQALVISAAAKEVPPGTVAPDSLRRALESKLPLLDRHALETTALFARLPLQDRRRVARAIQADPNLPAHMAARINRLGAEVGGVHSDARESLEYAARTISFRLRKQPPSAFFDEQVRKVERVASLRGLDATVQRMIATHASTTAILQAMQHTGGGAGSGLTAPEEAPPAPPTPPPTLFAPDPGWTEPEPEDQSRRGVIPAAIGGVMLGVGGILLGISIPLVSENLGWAFMITAGIVIALGGIILLLVGAGLAASA